MSQFIFMHSRDFPTVLTTQMLWTVSDVSNIILPSGREKDRFI